MTLQERLALIARATKMQGIAAAAEASARTEIEMAIRASAKLRELLIAEHLALGMSFQQIKAIPLLLDMAKTEESLQDLLASFPAGQP